MRKTILAVMMALLCGVDRASAQDAPPARRGVWLSAGLGSGMHGDQELGAFMAQLTHQRASHLFGLRYALLADIFGNSGDAVGELGVTYGRALTYDYGHAAVGAGLAITSAVDCSPAGSSCLQAGIPLLAEVTLRPVPVLGGGVQAFANVNGGRSYWGFMLFIELGWLP